MSKVVNKFLAQTPTLTLKGNNTGGTANVTDLTVAQVNAILPVFTSSLNGLVPASGGGTTNFLRADGTFATPPSSGSTKQVAIGTPQTSDVTTTSTSYASLSTPITLSFTATASGKYRVYAVTTGNNSSNGQTNYLKVVATTGSPTANQVNVDIWIEPGGGFSQFGRPETIFTLVASTAYVFEMQARVSGATMTLNAAAQANEGNGLTLIAEQIE